MEEVSGAQKLLLDHGGASTFLGPVSEALVLLQPQYPHLSLSGQGSVSLNAGLNRNPKS